MVAQAVVEEIALPTHAIFSGDKLLPVFDGHLHSRFARERNNGMQMIRHQQAQPAMPDESLVIEFHGSEYGIASVCAAQLVFTQRHAVDGDKEPTALGHPLWNCVRQLFANGQIHARSVAIPSRCDKREKVGQAVLCRFGRACHSRARRCSCFPRRAEDCAPYLTRLI
jgi:hypothetical protein